MRQQEAQQTALDRRRAKPRHVGGGRAATAVRLLRRGLRLPPTLAGQSGCAGYEALVESLPTAHQTGPSSACRIAGEKAQKLTLVFAPAYTANRLRIPLSDRESGPRRRMISYSIRARSPLEVQSDSKDAIP